MHHFHKQTLYKYFKDAIAPHMSKVIKSRHFSYRQHNKTRCKILIRGTKPKINGSFSNHKI